MILMDCRHMAVDQCLAEIRRLFDEHGGDPYSAEAVTQMEHALQSADLAETAGAPDALVVAALLHDLGHMMVDRAARNPAHVDDLHQFRAIPMLRRLFPASVIEPIRLHVEAKRYLCAVDAAYAAALSPVSVNSLRLQGGSFTIDEVSRFERLAHWEDAVRLRRWDDAAKVPGKSTPALHHFFRKVARVIEPAA